MGTQLPQKRGTVPQFLAHVCCGQMAGWIKMWLGREADLGPGNVLLDEDPAPPPKGAQPPVFAPCVLWPTGWMDQDATWYGDRPRRRPHCIKWGPSFAPQEGAQHPPPFDPCLLWPNSRPSQLLLSGCRKFFRVLSCLCLVVSCFIFTFLQCFDAVGWVAERASGL